MRHRVLSIVLTAALCCTTASAGQQARPSGAAPEPQNPTFRLQVEVVEMDVRVTDANGNFVRNLTKDDFQIFEDGKEQTVTTFSLVDIPIEPSSQPGSRSLPIEPTSRVQAPRRRPRVRDAPGRPEYPPRSDRSHEERRAPVRRAAPGNERPDGDRMTQAAAPAQEFTSNKRSCCRRSTSSSARKYRNGRCRNRGSVHRRSIAPDQFFTAAGGMDVRWRKQVMTALSTVAAWLDGITGRKKAVILVERWVRRTGSTKIADDIRPSGRIGRMNMNVYASTCAGLARCRRRPTS